MKMKRLFAAFVSFLVIFAVAGCSNGDSSSQASAVSNGPQHAANGFTKPDVYGEVAKINGNEVTLKLMEIPQRKGGNKQNRHNGQNNEQNGGNITAGNGNGAGGPNRNGAKRYTGEEKTITIPDGVSIVTMTRGTNGMTKNQITLKDISVGSILAIYYKSDGKTINKIRVMKPRAVGGQGTNANTDTNSNTTSPDTTI